MQHTGLLAALMQHSELIVTVLIGIGLALLATVAFVLMLGPGLSAAQNRNERVALLLARVILELTICAAVIVVTGAFVWAGWRDAPLGGAAYFGGRFLLFALEFYFFANNN